MFLQKAANLVQLLWHQCEDLSIFNGQSDKQLWVDPAKFWMIQTAQCLQSHKLLLGNRPDGLIPDFKKILLNGPVQIPLDGLLITEPIPLLLCIIDAIEGYSVRALDYVLKPVQYYAFAAKLDQVCEILASRQRRPILISSREGQIKLLPEQIFYVEVQDHTLCYHTKQQLLHTTGTQSLGKLAQELTDSGFARCHQAYLVNLHYVTGYDRSSVFLGEQVLPMSRSYYKNFVQALVEHCAGEGNL